jgi:hypothetical protein
MGVACTVRADVVERRGAEAPLDGRILSVDDNGISLKSDELGALYFVPWDRVRAVRTDRPDTRLPALLRRATDLWRARSRVERYDTAMAEPLLERLWADYEGRTHETALVVAEGLLRCRLDRGDYAGALVPALEVARLRRSGLSTDSYSMLTPVLDEELWLSPRLAPAWKPSRALTKLASDLRAYDARGDEVVAAIAALYQASIDTVLGDAPKIVPEVPDESGVTMLDAVIHCRDSDDQVRTAAREWLLRSIGFLPSWTEAWVRYFVGLSMLEERGVGRRQEGLWHLAHLPARYERSNPLLTARSLESMVPVLRAMGDTEGADAMQAEYDRLSVVR